MSRPRADRNGLRMRRFLVIAWLLVLPLAACKKPEPAAGSSAAAPQRHDDSRLRGKPGSRERREYTDMPANGAPGGAYTATSNEQAIKAEAMRGGPRGEARIFENAQEQAELARGAAPKYMNGQFRYYLVGVSQTRPGEGGCSQPGLAIRLAVENLHGAATAAIHGTFTFGQTVGVDGAAMADTVAVPYRADIVGPFSDKRGGIVYVTAYAEHTDPSRDPTHWAQVAAVEPARLKVWFRPEVFHDPDGTQYAHRSGAGPATRAAMAGGGSEGASRAVAR